MRRNTTGANTGRKLCQNVADHIRPTPSHLRRRRVVGVVDIHDREGTPVAAVEAVKGLRFAVLIKDVLKVRSRGVRVSSYRKSVEGGTRGEQLIMG